MICFDFCIGRYGTDENEVEAESELVHAAIRYYISAAPRRVRSTFILLSTMLMAV